jgi:predicted GIY-YIG superfamily endonuclease
MSITQGPTSVYIAFDIEGTCLYVGVTGKGVSRSWQHQDSSVWWEQMVEQRWEHYATRREALDREQELIEQLKPLCNIAGTTTVCPYCDIVFKKNGMAAHVTMKHGKEYLRRLAQIGAGI